MIASMSAPRFSPAFRAASRLCADAAAAIGLLGLIAWAFDAERFLQALPGEVAMVPNTALGFVLLGLSLRGRVARSGAGRRAAVAAGVGAAGLGLLSALQSLTGRSFGIDELLFRDTAHLTGTPAGRMAFTTAVSFAALGIASALPKSRRAHTASFVLFLVPALAAAVSLAGFAYHTPSVLWIGGFKGMALVTAVAFLLSCASLASSDPERGIAAVVAGDTLGGLMVRRVLPPATVVLFALGWLHMATEKAGFYSAGLATALEVVANVALIGVIVVWSGVTIARLDADRSRAEEALRHAQKMEAVGRLAGGVAHDFNNLLTVISGYGDLLKGSLPPGSPDREAAEEILAAAERATGLTRQLLAFSRKQVLEPRPVSLNEIVEGMSRMFPRVLGEDVQLSTTLEPDLPLVLADPGQIEQVLLNLAVNARDAMPRGGRLTVETRSLPRVDARSGGKLPSGPCVVLAVRDTGTGMDDATLARAFEPFFTTKGPGKGTGLGLSTVHGIVEQSGGTLRATSAPGRGTSIEIFLPRTADPTALQGKLRVSGSMPVVRAETVLLVEDDPAVRRLAREVLATKGYVVLVAASGEEALRIGGEHAGPIDLMLSDVVMPGMDGPAVAARMRERHPTLRILFMSGYSDEAVARHGVLEEGAAFLGKPFAPAALIEKVREVMAG